jgi:hypothetical protein
MSDRWCWWTRDDRQGTGWWRCPYGRPGDRLWVKEAMRFERALEDGVETSVFVADGARTKADAWPWKLKTLPGMFMPYGLRRITLEVTGVHIERLNDTSEEDALAEGVEAAPFCKSGRLAGMEHAEAFSDLWDRINAKRAPWSSNPWVWVVEFRRVP